MFATNGATRGLYACWFGYIDLNTIFVIRADVHVGNRSLLFLCAGSGIAVFVWGYG